MSASVRVCVTTEPGISSCRFQQRENILWVLGLPVRSPPAFTASFLPGSPLLLFAFDEFLAYFLAETLGHVFAGDGRSNQWNL